MGLAGRGGSSSSGSGAGCAAVSAAGCLDLGGCRLGGGSGALARVVVYIKTGAFEAQAGRGERAFKLALAHGTDKFRLGTEVLDFFKAVTALGTTIGI
jgi:hypothetical protein